MKLWQKNYRLQEAVERFTVGKDRELDLFLARYDVLGSMAHAIMLQHAGLLNEQESKDLLRELRHILSIIKEGKFVIEEGVEDVHSQIELLLTRAVGPAGEKIHTGRSRNDQVLTDLKLFFRSQIRETAEIVIQVFNTLQALSEQHKENLLPGYTHFQAAMPSSFGLWFGAYAESLVDDMELLLTAYRVSNKNPLGSAAGYGSSLPVNRQMTAELLGFKTLNFNSVYAQMSRGKTEKIIAQALAGVAATLSRMAMDICLYMSADLGFVSFPDELTTGSSIMPHKKNPDAWELIRARCNRLQALPNELTLLTGNLPSGYHRDLQLTKEILFPAFGELKGCLEMAAFMLQHIRIKTNILKEDKYNCLFSVEAVNTEVLQGVPFRKAYRNIGARIGEQLFQPPAFESYSHEGSIGNLQNEQIKIEMDRVFNEFDFQEMEKKLEKLERL